MCLKILAIDTSTEACSAALLLGDEVRERFEIAPRRHSELILPMIDELFREAGLTLDLARGARFRPGTGLFYRGSHRRRCDSRAGPRRRSRRRADLHFGGSRARRT